MNHNYDHRMEDYFYTKKQAKQQMQAQGPTQAAYYKEIEFEVNRKYQKKLDLLKEENYSLKSEIEILKEKRHFERDETIVNLRAENVLLIQEYETKIGEKLKEMNRLRHIIFNFENPKEDGDNPFQDRIQELEQQIRHKEILLTNCQHENEILKTKILGLETRVSTLLMDKETALDLAEQSYNEKIGAISMENAIIRKENSDLKKQLEMPTARFEPASRRTSANLPYEEFRKLPEKPSESKEAKRYKRLYLQEKQNYQELSQLMDERREAMTKEMEDNNALNDFVAQVDSMVSKGKLAEQRLENLMVSRFLLGLELARISATF